MKFKDFSKEQLYLIEAGINEDLNIKSYAKPQLTDEEFRLEFLIRLLAKHKNYDIEDVKTYLNGTLCGFNFYQIQELAKGYKLKVPYELYKRVDYDAKQMKEIRIAMQKGENYNMILGSSIPYNTMHRIRMNLKKGVFTDRQLDLIRKCKREGFDVSIISNPKYSYSKMKYILTDMRAGRELEYLNGKYSSEHIKYIRKAMIRKLDPKPLYNPKLSIFKVKSLFKCLNSVNHN